MDTVSYNTQLEKMSAEVFGEGMTLQVCAPASLSLLKENARYFKKEMFQQLRDNIKQDKRLSSVPLCYKHEDGTLEVLSGNHRVQASIEAGLQMIPVLVITEHLSKSRRIAIQLSHNALVGEDDKNILAELWAKMDDITDNLYAGLSSDVVEGLEKIDLVPFTTPQVYTRSMTFAFAETEAAHFNAVLDNLSECPAKEIYLADLKQFQRFYDTLEATKKKFDVKNSSLAILKLTELAEERLAQLHAEEPQEAQA